jgi:hypothetical protein
MHIRPRNHDFTHLHLAEFDRADATSEAVGAAMMGGTPRAEKAA